VNERIPAKRAILAAAALLAALAAAAPAAPARSPSAPEQKSADWILDRLQKDREEDGKSAATPQSDPIADYQKGVTALDQWKTLTDQIGDRRLSPLVRATATSAVLARFKMEDERKVIDAKVLEDARRKICLSLLDLMVGDDSNGRQCVHRLTMSLLPPKLVVAWDPNDPYNRRKRARDDLAKKLK
jgi:hypothetical protein